MDGKRRISGNVLLYWKMVCFLVMNFILPEKEKGGYLEILKKSILREVLVVKSENIRITDNKEGEMPWLLDFRRVLLKGKFLNIITRLFLDRLSNEGINLFQVGGLEAAAIPLVSGIVLNSSRDGVDINGFFVRKSRKKSGLLQFIEGSLNEEKIILVDDLLNSGSSFLRQIKVLETLGRKVEAVLVVVRFKEESYYEELTNRGIKIYSLFTASDFPTIFSKKEDRVISTQKLPQLAELWTFASPKPKHEYVIPKSSPCLYDGKLFFGSDSGTFWCLDATTGRVLWRREVVYGVMGKRIFSSPCVYGGVVFFGGYDGNFYALDIDTGKPQWIAFDADWIGSSPCVADDLGLVYVGMEYGFWKKKGGVAAYAVNDGELVWKSESNEYTHGSPVYSKKNKVVICGSNDGLVSCFNAKTGKLLWSYDAGGEIKAGCSLSPLEKYVAFGSFNKNFTVLETKSGKIVSFFETVEANYSTPAWAGEDNIICASLDKCIYNFSLKEKKVTWKVSTGARIFSSPTVCGENVYIGNNAGIFYIIDIKTGVIVTQQQVVERITNKIIFNKKVNCFYIPTNANEIICLSPLI